MNLIVSASHFVPSTDLSNHLGETHKWKIGHVNSILGGLIFLRLSNQCEYELLYEQNVDSSIGSQQRQVLVGFA